MARMLNQWEAAERRRQQEAEERARKEREDAFIAEWMQASEEEKARMIFSALSQKAEKYHDHPPETY